MLSLLFQKSLSRSLEGQRERGENREIQEETRTASPGGRGAGLGTRRAGRARVGSCGRKEAGGRAAGAPRTRTRTRTHSRVGEAVRRRGEPQVGHWSLVPWEAGGREKDGERGGGRGGAGAKARGGMREGVGG